MYILLMLLGLAVWKRSALWTLLTRASGSIRSTTGAGGAVTHAWLTGIVVLTGLGLWWGSTWVGTGGWSHWLYVIIALGVLYSVIAINKVALGASAATLQIILMVIAVAIFVAYPLWSATSWANKRSIARTSSPQVALTLTMAPYGDSVMLRIPTNKRMRTLDEDMGGYESRCVYPESRLGESCAMGDCVRPVMFCFVRNLTGETNTAHYEFFR